VPRPPSITAFRRLLQARRRLDLSGDDLLPQDRDLREDLPLQLARQTRAELAQGDALVLQVVDDVRSAFELAGLRVLDCEEDAVVDALHRARQDVRAQERLILVDADREEAVILRRVERAEAAQTGDAEDDLRAARDLVLGDVLAEVLRHEVLRIPDLDL